MSTITYDDALAELDEGLERVTDEVHDILVRMGCDEEQISRGLQAFYQVRDRMRAKSLADLGPAVQPLRDDSLMPTLTGVDREAAKKP